jgi:hypothetical protein
MTETQEQRADRLIDEQANLREAVNHNADLYRRDVQHGLDLLADVYKGALSPYEAWCKLEGAHNEGRKALRDAGA